jgi:hypothetical protein
MIEGSLMATRTSWAWPVGCMVGRWALKLAGGGGAEPTRGAVEGPTAASCGVALSGRVTPSRPPSFAAAPCGFCGAAHKLGPLSRSSGPCGAGRA